MRKRPSVELSAHVQCPPGGESYFNTQIRAEKSIGKHHTISYGELTVNKFTSYSAGYAGNESESYRGADEKRRVKSFMVYVFFSKRLEHGQLQLPVSAEGKIELESR